MANHPHSGKLGRHNALQLDGLVYHYLKEKNLATLRDVFSKERCQELEKCDHLYSNYSLALMLLKLRTDRKKPFAQKNREKHVILQKETEANRAHASHPKPPVDRTYNHDLMHRSFCHLSDFKRILNLTIFNHFHLSGDQKALKLLFDGETLEEYGRTEKEMDIPSVLRMVAFRKQEKLKVLSTNRKHPGIFMCQFCKKELKGPRPNITNHIGVHEDIPTSCPVEGCDSIVKQYASIGMHLKNKHQLNVKDLTPEQYYHHQSTKIAYSKKAGQFMDRYFPPESFVRFSDKRIWSATELESMKCSDCGVIAKIPVGRRNHVAGHLKLTYKCMMEGCGHRAANPTSFTTHLKNHHSKKVSDLGVKELGKFKQMKLDFARVMKEELPKLFPLTNTS